MFHTGKFYFPKVNTNLTNKILRITNDKGTYYVPTWKKNMGGSKGWLCTIRVNQNQSINFHYLAMKILILTKILIQLKSYKNSITLFARMDISFTTRVISPVNMNKQNCDRFHRCSIQLFHTEKVDLMFDIISPDQRSAIIFSLTLHSV